jgi:hypothetical protein
MRIVSSVGIYVLVEDDTRWHVGPFGGPYLDVDRKQNPNFAKALAAKWGFRELIPIEIAGLDDVLRCIKAIRDQRDGEPLYFA